jgi:nucleotide-binding universal stress UspA family protein
MFNNVMIGIDDQQGGRDAIQLARQLVSDDGQLTLAYVHGGFPLIGRGSNADFEASERDRALALLSKASAETGIETVRCVGSPSVGRGLHELAEANGAGSWSSDPRGTDCSAASSSETTPSTVSTAPSAPLPRPAGRRLARLCPIGRLLHGSTTHRLARLARCPLLVLTRAARAADAAPSTHDDRHALAAGA